VEALAYLAPFVAFLILYVGLRRRAARHGATPPIQWGWLAAIAACAAAAALLGLLV
jgi:hypothetical protein